MVLYSDTISPIGHGVRIVLAEKDINVEINYIAEDQRPEELNDLNPYNTVLTLIDRDLVLYDAQIIMEYLDERFPHPPLMPVDPVSRASNRQLRYRVINDLYSLLDDIEGEDENEQQSDDKNEDGQLAYSDGPEREIVHDYGHCARRDGRFSPGY